MSWLRWLRGGVIAAAAVLGIAALSRLPFTPAGGDYAILRLSWRMRGERIENCRTRSQAELDALPMHMRTPTACEGHSVFYTLQVTTGKGPTDSRRIAPAGAKGDRPIFVLHQTAVRPGPQRVRIRFAAESHGDAPRSAVVIDTVITFKAGHVELITLSDDARSFVHRTAQ